MVLFESFWASCDPYQLVSIINICRYILCLVCIGVGALPFAIGFVNSNKLLMILGTIFILCCGLGIIIVMDGYHYLDDKYHLDEHDQIPELLTTQPAATPVNIADCNCTCNCAWGTYNKTVQIPITPIRGNDND